jgi:hypothetical protein
MQEDSEEIIGAGVYIQASCFDHACRPNASFRFPGQGQDVEVRAIHPIQKYGDVRVSYLKEYLTKEERLLALRRHYHFECECEMCLLENNEEVEAGLIPREILLLSKMDDDWKEILVYGDGLLKKLTHPMRK